MADKNFDIAGYVFPIFSAKPGKGGFHINRFIGSGFWIDSKGHFLTCAHVLDELEEDLAPVIGHPFGKMRNSFTPILYDEKHSKFDVALGAAKIKEPTTFLRPYRGSVQPGLDIGAFGFTDAGKVAKSLQLDVHYLKGHIVRTSEESMGLPTARVVETSFGSPSGFSGTPLLVDFQFAGMLYSNIESKLQSYSISEVLDEGKEIRETAYRVYEYGLAHHPEDIIEFVKACGIKPFE